MTCSQMGRRFSCSQDVKWWEIVSKLLAKNLAHSPVVVCGGRLRCGSEYVVDLPAPEGMGHLNVVGHLLCKDKPLPSCLVVNVNGVYSDKGHKLLDWCPLDCFDGPKTHLSTLLAPSAFNVQSLDWFYVFGRRVSKSTTALASLLHAAPTLLPMTASGWLFAAMPFGCFVVDSMFNNSPPVWFSSSENVDWLTSRLQRSSFAAISTFYSLKNSFVDFLAAYVSRESSPSDAFVISKQGDYVWFYPAEHVPFDASFVTSLVPRALRSINRAVQEGPIIQLSSSERDALRKASQFSWADVGAAADYSFAEIELPKLCLAPDGWRVIEGRVTAEDKRSGVYSSLSFCGVSVAKLLGPDLEDWRMYLTLSFAPYPLICLNSKRPRTLFAFSSLDCLSDRWRT